MLFRNAVNRGLVGLGRSGAERERHVAEAKLEQPIAAPRLAVVIALRHGAGNDLDLAIVGTEAAVTRPFDQLITGQRKSERKLVKKAERALENVEDVPRW